MNLNLLDKLLRSLGLVTLVLYLYRLQKYFLARQTRERDQLQTKYGSPNCWAVVTGGSSGIGEACAIELAKQGFNLLLIARREDLLKEKCEKLKNIFQIKAKYLTFDFTKTVENSSFLVKNVTDITNGNIAIIVHMAGNSDLAYHFTDKSLERNIELFRLNAESTLVMLQEFCPLLCIREKRSAIITSGALSAFTPLPGYACSSANKAYIRAITLAASYEFKEKIDIMCAHPIAVKSEILKGEVSNVVVSSNDFASNIFKDLEYENETTGGFIIHDFLVWAFSNLPQQKVMDYNRYNNPRYSKLLNRPIDMRPLSEKFA